jgi:hypothetical protein
MGKVGSSTVVFFTWRPFVNMSFGYRRPAGMPAFRRSLVNLIKPPFDLGSRWVRSSQMIWMTELSPTFQPSSKEPIAAIYLSGITGKVSDHADVPIRLYVKPGGSQTSPGSYRAALLISISRTWYVVDPMLRVL